MIERRFIDLGAVRPGITPLTRADDAHFSAVLCLARDQSFHWNSDVRVDLFVLEGAVRDKAGRRPAAGDFLSRCESGSLVVDDAPALLFAYRERRMHDCRNIDLPVGAREWLASPVRSMETATLSDIGHRVSLVRWHPGAHVRPHAHGDGEELLVLEGELRNGDEAYPRGTWLRLHAQDTHAPFAEVPALTLLRTGHLGAPPQRTRERQMAGIATGVETIEQDNDIQKH